MPVKLNFEFKELLDSLIDGDLYNYCYQCGACVGDCPSAKYFPEFNPRLIMLQARLGLKEALAKPDSIVWKCTNCYTCYERCPQDVRPVEVITAIKNLIVSLGMAPKEVTEPVERFKRTGRPVLITEAVKRIRSELGLDPIEDVPAEEIEKIIR
jgi:heterodisulfide reductase subunit C